MFNVCRAACTLLCVGVPLRESRGQELFLSPIEGTNARKGFRLLSIHFCSTYMYDRTTLSFSLTRLLPLIFIFFPLCNFIITTYLLHLDTQFFAPHGNFRGELLCVVCYVALLRSSLISFF